MKKNDVGDDDHIFFWTRIFINAQLELIHLEVHNKYTLLCLCLFATNFIDFLLTEPVC